MDEEQRTLYAKVAELQREALEKDIHPKAEEVKAALCSGRTYERLGLGDLVSSLHEQAESSELVIDRNSFGLTSTTTIKYQGKLVFESSRFPVMGGPSIDIKAYVPGPDDWEAALDSLYERAEAIAQERTDVEKSIAETGLDPSHLSGTTDAELRERFGL